jgi:outer membrane protein TolC
LIFTGSAVKSQNQSPVQKEQVVNDNLEFQNKLIELAWENAITRKILHHEELIADLNISKSKRIWLNNIYASGNLNEFTLKELTGNDSDLVNNFYPRYNFGINISLGTIFSTGLETKIAKENLKISQENLLEYKNLLAAEVLKQYQTYIMYEKIYKIQGDMAADENSKLLLLEEQFKAGEIELENYNEGFDSYNNALIKQAEAERNYQIAKIELERLIGLPLEQIK